MKIAREQLKLYAVTDTRWLKEGETFNDVLEELINAGVTCVQLRDKTATDQQLIKMAQELKKLCNKHNVPLIINDRPDIAKMVQADGVHVGLSDMEIEKTRQILGDDYIIGASAHNVKEALHAQKAGADYIGCGAVFGSNTKTNVTTLPITELKAICESVRIPAVAIGGITEENVKLLKGTGVSGVAVISALFAAKDKTKAAKNILHRLFGVS